MTPAPASLLLQLAREQWTLIDRDHHPHIDSYFKKQINAYWIQQYAASDS